MSEKKIKSALISVYHKEGLDNILRMLNELNVRIFSTGGTFDHITRAGISAEKVEDLTGYPSILGGRVKTLHPSVFGGILARRDNSGDMEQMAGYRIPEIDLVIVDLYPFEETVRNTDDQVEITEKIDIGGISLIRAAAKNFRDVLVISSRDQYGRLLELLREKKGVTSLSDRRRFAAEAFMTSSHYDTEIFRYYNLAEGLPVF
ncbi:MAG: bifunctional phosphoribosylaminoimidazolecarboxamide formyltransferase/IMP cyclohydrolase PurH, partial [Bacteroidales bacterium]|nr:bifunctional phosphoribosylaminoimidazolecarboxamide formyltransferase/IMP cyclohydrolase PurH [Bacteroidales bacterium]